MNIVEENKEMETFLKKGDERCSIAIGSQVVKSLCEEGDGTPLGTSGIVEGSCYLTDDMLPLNVTCNEAYLVQFDGFPAPTFIVGTKISKV